VQALALRAEEREHLGRLGPGAAEPVRDARVELRDLAGRHDEIMLGQSQSQLPGQHVHPLVALVRFLLRAGPLLSADRRDDHLVRPRPARPLGQRDERPAIAVERLQLDPRVADRGRAHEVVERDLVGAGQGEQQFQGRLAAAGFQPRQRAGGDAGHGRQPRE
jgi:hypothetical protein